MKSTPKFSPGDRVEAFRENTPETVEWAGSVENARRSFQVTVVVDGMKVAGGPYKGQPVRVAFTGSGVRMTPSYGPQLKIRKVEGD
ncbi:MAG: hypothetical protein EBY17_25150 [Acidobacteriia bacterium]|jgi:hypothetical protein|nr:hypothetical protein [Terriglobia bacterium]